MSNGVSAAAIKALREKTGVGIVECKAALSEAKGDEEKAIEILRKRGLATASKKAGRVAAEGLVRALSALFREMPEVYRSEVSWSAGVHRTRYLNSEGTAFTRAAPWVISRGFRSKKACAITCSGCTETRLPA